VTGKRGTRRKQILNDREEMRGHWKLKEETPGRTLGRTHFRRDYGTAIRQTMTLMSTDCSFQTILLGCLLPKHSQKCCVRRPNT
jgi:hypothetical protein